MSDTNEPRSLPLGFVLLGVMAVVGIFFWCCAASSYATVVEGRRLGGVRSPRQFGKAALLFFFMNGVIQIGNLPSVLSHTAEQQWWVMIGFVVVETLVWLLFVGMYFLEKKLDGPGSR